MKELISFYADFGDDNYEFRLGVEQIRELERKTEAGVYQVFRRIVGGSWFADDVRETIRLGLIGGGTEAVKALRLVRTYVDGKPLADAAPLATRILQSALFGEGGLEEDFAEVASADI